MQKLILLISMVLVSLSVSGQIELSDGLQAYFPFNGNANDESGSNHTSEISGAVLDSDKNGFFERSFSFDGIDDYIQILNANALDFNNQESFAISLWFKAGESTSGESSSDILSKWQSASLGDPYSYTVRITTKSASNPGEVSVSRFDSNNPGCGNVISIRSEPIYNDEEWHHIVYQLTENNLLELFVDCELIGTMEDSSSCSFISNSDIFLGMRTPLNSNSIQPYAGNIDELRIYDRQLSMEEIELLCSQVNTTANIERINKVEIFPNPTNGNVTIVPKKETKLASGKVYDLNGSFIMNMESPNFQLIGSQGVYLLVLRFEDGTTSLHRIIKTNTDRV